MNPKIIILMCTYNGARFLREQLDSIRDQTYPSWKLVVSDDGSTDETLLILEQYQRDWGRNKLEIRNGPRQGFSQNFLSLAAMNIDGDYFAFSDQDDVWLPNKLESALEFIAHVAEHTPLLYCGSTTYVDDKLKSIGGSPIFLGNHNFGNALVQNIAGGNTMLFNSATKKLLEKFGMVDVPLHDWWLYLVVTAVGGEVYYDVKSYILYRQHEGSLIGGNSSLFERFVRLKNLFLGTFRDSVDKNITALNSYSKLLCLDSIDLLGRFRQERDSGFFIRLSMIRRCKLKRNSLGGTISLYIAAMFKRI